MTKSDSMNRKELAKGFSQKLLAATGKVIHGVTMHSGRDNTSQTASKEMLGPLLVEGSKL